MSDIKRIKELVKILKEASEVYYSGEDDLMSNFEYDKLYDELTILEKKTGIVMNDSPTIHVEYDALSDLLKERHVAPMLSLAKTKDTNELKSWLGDKTGLLSMKLDGLSVILTYDAGVLTKALTRGNGEVGELITNNAKTFKNIPGHIPYNGHIVIRGEALIRYSDFKKLNASEDELLAYKNPRNLCSGSVRQLNNEVTAKRQVRFYVYNLIESDMGDYAHKKDVLDAISDMGFDIVPYKVVTKDNIEKSVDIFAKEVTNSDLPSDGLVLTYDDIAYSESLGRTAKSPRDSIALKWQDETADTILRDIEWSASRTGRINPVAVFDPVELEGTTVRRAGVHNVSILNHLKLGIGDEISVYKANMIIPQISENKTKSGSIVPPKRCPVCDHETKLVTENGSTFLICPNPDCYAKQIRSLVHYVSRDAMNIDGLSEATLEKLIDKRLVKNIPDIYTLYKHKDEIISDDELMIRDKSYQNLIDAIERSKDTEISNVIYALGIAGIGLATAKDIVHAYPDKDLSELTRLSVDELLSVRGIGNTLAEGYTDFFSDTEHTKLVTILSDILRIKRSDNIRTDSDVSGKVFVITGSLNTFANRNELKSRLEALGARVSSSVSVKTDYLVNNDALSSSSKNKKAKELGIPILTEDELLEML